MTDRPTDRPEARRPSWMKRTPYAAEAGPLEGSLAGNGFGPFDGGDPLEEGVDRLRQEALRAAREDAAAQVPKADVEGRSESEEELRDRCKALFQRWQSHERRRFHELVAEAEQHVSEKLGLASLAIDRFERLTNDLVRLRAKVSLRRNEVNEELGEKRKAPHGRGIPTKVYLSAIGFLGLVEFFANAPVFGALLPRDPLTERQIRLVAETSEGWMAGAERVMAQFILRPDAALLAAGVVTFLCVLAHFFGHSLRDLVMQRDRRARRQTVSGRSPMESVVPMILSGFGLILVVAVLYEARLTLGRVGEEQFGQDMAAVEELRRNAGWLRVDGDLLAANEMTNRADDLESAANNLREYAGAMSRLSFPVLLLNTTLVLCAMTAAYFHRRDERREYFDDSPFEEERRIHIEAAEAEAAGVSTLLSELVRHIRGLRILVASPPLRNWRGVAHQLEAVIALYRSENGRARGLDPRTIPAFREPVSLDLRTDDDLSRELATRDPGEYDRERGELKERFEEVRRRFTQEAIAW